MSSKDVSILPCPFCGAAAREFMWPKHYGCSDEKCGAHAANLTAEQWNRRAPVETPAHRKWPGEPPHCPSCSCGAKWLAEKASEPQCICATTAEPLRHVDPQCPKHSTRGCSGD
jgi:hypothetical protein